MIETQLAPRLDLVEEDGSVRPATDTGFRMQPTEPSTYTPRQNPPKPSGVEYLHVDDIASSEATHLRGVNYITVNYDAAQRRVQNDLWRNIRIRKEREEKITA